MDLAQLSDEQLMQAAGGGGFKTPAAPVMDYSSLSDDELMEAAGIGAEPDQQPSFMQRLNDSFANRKKLARQLGLTGRYVAEGVTSLAAPIADPLAAASNYAFGTNLPSSGQAVSRVLTSAGLPEPENANERVVGDISRAIVGVGTGGSVAKLAGAPQYVINSLVDNLGTQFASAVGASGASGIARENGNDASTQLAAGLIGGIVPVGGYQSAARGLNSLVQAGKDAARPFTTTGREQLVGSLLKENAIRPNDVINNLGNVVEYIPNSPVTTGEAAGDAGIAALQRGFRNQAGNTFADIESQQNAARQQALEALAGTPQELQGAVQNRSMVTGPLYDKAALEPLAGKNYDAILGKIDEALKTVGTNTQAGKELLNIRNGITSSLPSNINPEARQGALTQLYRELRDKAAKTAELDGAFPAAVKGVVKPIISDFGQALEDQSANLAQANTKFRELSPEIAQMTALQDLRDRVSLTGSPDTRAGYEFLSQPKLTARLRDPELAETLTPEQLQQLRNISADAERSASLNTRNIRPTGSDTIQNLNGGKVVRQFLSESAVGKLPLGIGRVLQSLSEKQINELTMESLKDPQLARRLLVELKPETANQPISGAVAQKLTAQLLGSIRGTLSTPSEQVQ